MDMFRLFRLFRLFLLHSIVFFRLSGGVSLDHSMVTAEQLAHHLPEVYTPTQHQADMDENYKDSVSADYDTKYSKTALSAKPKNFTSTLSTKRTRKGKIPPKDRNNNPCLKNEYRGYCVHGVCQYLKELNSTSCICNEGYTGERCHFFSLPVGKDDVKGDNTTALAVTAAVLSLTCLTIIAILLAIRYNKKNESNEDEKIRLEAATVQ